MPKQTEVLIVGGGIIGSFTAYWVKKISPSFNVTVVERDPDYSQSSTYWSVGGFRQQFSLPENIKMSLFGVDFLKRAHEELKCEDDHEVDLPINHDGYLFLASKNSADKLYENHKIQLSNKAKVTLLNKKELESKFSWINTNGVEFGSFGYMNEGWVDARKYLLAVRRKAIFLGVDYVKGQVIDFEEQKDSSFITPIKPINTALVDTFDNKLVPIKYQTVVNAAGPWAGNVARLAKIGSENFDDLQKITALSVSLPVEPRKRYIYLFYCENGPILNVPLVIDHSGVFFKRHQLSNYYLCGLNQCPSDEPTDLDLKNIDYKYFEQKIKPVLIDRVPAFKNLKLVNAWAGYYDYNTLDQNLIIGKHPVHSNFLFANGSSGHGLQHAAAIGHALTELICYGNYKTLDLKRFGFERVMRDQPLKEIDVV